MPEVRLMLTSFVFIVRSVFRPQISLSGCFRVVLTLTKVFIMFSPELPPFKRDFPLAVIPTEVGIQVEESRADRESRRYIPMYAMYIMVVYIMLILTLSI